MLLEIFRISSKRLPSPRILFTIDSSEPKFEPEIRPILEIFARCQVPLTMFISNETLSGKDNSEEITKIRKFADGRSLVVEIASHGVRHHDMSCEMPYQIAGRVAESVERFRHRKIFVQGFRAPFLSTEFIYKEVIEALDTLQVPLAYDSSISFESNLMTDLIQLAIGKKMPHKIGSIWELPISGLDDYHLLHGKKSIRHLAFIYWVLIATIWICRKNYFMLLFHPHVILNHLNLLNKLVIFLKKKFHPFSFTTCAGLVAEMESQWIHAADRHKKMI